MYVKVHLKSFLPLNVTLFKRILVIKNYEKEVCGE